MRTSILSVGLCGAALLAVPLAIQAQDKPVPRTSPDVKESGDNVAPAAVISKVHHINKMEMSMGKLASERASGDEVRRYGDRLYKDHASADAKIADFARKNGIVLADVPPMTPQDEEDMAVEMATMKALQALKGKDFDRLFLSTMKDGHEKAISYLERVTPKLENSDLRELLERTLPILQQHRAMAEKLLTDLKREG